MALTTADSGNILVRNYGRNPAVNFNFMLRVEGIYDLPCKAVHSFQRENEYEYIQEGGLNDYVHMRRKPISKPFTFQVERYVGTDILDPLSLGTDLALPIILIVNRYLIYGDFVPVRSYTFTGCTVMAKQYGELDAEKSGLLVETTTIAYREMFCMENVAGSFLMEEPWGFDGQKMEGSNERHARHPQNEVRGRDMPSKKWMFVGGNTQRAQQASGQDNRNQEERAPYVGGVNGSSVHNAGEVRKAEMEGKARKWTFGDEENGSSVRNADEVRKEEMEGKARKWTFGDEENGSSVRNADEVRKEEMEGAARKWTFGDEGNGSSVRNADEVRKEEMEAAAQLRKWPAKKNAVDVATFLGMDANAGISKRKWPPDQSAVSVKPPSEENPEGQGS